MAYTRDGHFIDVGEEPSLLTPCNIEESSEPVTFFCLNHGLQANHQRLGSMVCTADAVLNGCSCCVQNHDKLVMTNRQRLDLFILGELRKTANLPNRTIIDNLIHKLRLEP